MTDEEIIRAFHLMWDNFPEPVMITQKSREMVALNKKAASFGLAVGVKCSSIGAPVYVTYEGPFGKSYGYWLPIPEKPEWVIHFGVGSTFDYEKAAFTRT